MTLARVYNGRFIAMEASGVASIHPGGLARATGYRYWSMPTLIARKRNVRARCYVNAARIRQAELYFR